MNFDLVVGAEHSIHEGDVHAILKVCASLGRVGAGLRSCAAKSTAEERVENVAESAESVETIETSATCRPSGGGVAVAVVCGPFLGIGQHLVGFIDLFEFVLCALGLVAVWVVLKRKFSERLLDIFLRCFAGDSEDVVIIFFASRHGSCRASFTGGTSC